MIADAVDGKIDLILTKSISRFGRNIVDILDNLQTLSALNPPVSVEFETEGITYTGDGRNNLLISLLAALAEMESQQKSEAIKAGIRWRMAEVSTSSPFRIRLASIVIISGGLSLSDRGKNC